MQAIFAHDQGVQAHKLRTLWQMQLIFFPLHVRNMQQYVRNSIHLSVLITILMNGENMISKSECRHKNTIKSGTHIYSDGVYAMLRCKDCFAVIKGTRKEQ